MQIAVTSRAVARSQTQQTNRDINWMPWPIQWAARHAHHHPGDTLGFVGSDPRMLLDDYGENLLCIDGTDELPIGSYIGPRGGVGDVEDPSVMEGRTEGHAEETLQSIGATEAPGVRLSGSAWITSQARPKSHRGTNLVDQRGEGRGRNEDMHDDQKMVPHPSSLTTWGASNIVEALDMK